MIPHIMVDPSPAAAGEHAVIVVYIIGPVGFMDSLIKRLDERHPSSRLNLMVPFNLFEKRDAHRTCRRLVAATKAMHSCSLKIRDSVQVGSSSSRMM
jgi:hypothetical protein